MRSAICGKPVVAGVGGAVRGSSSQCGLAGPSARTTVGGCGSTTVLGEVCGFIPFEAGDCDVWGW